MSTNGRWNRLFSADGKCLQVALDHGSANVANLLPGIENMGRVVSTIAAANPDALLLTSGQAHWLLDLPQKPKPALVLRGDFTNFYMVPTPREIFCSLIGEPVAQALKLDAACLIVNLLWAPDQPDLHRQCVENVMRLKPECERLGIPLMVEPLVMIPDGRGSYQLNNDIGRTTALGRQSVELGADIVKADIAENIDDYHLVVEASSPRPLLPRGGARVSEREILTRTHKLIEQGAAGVVYGRNIYQHPDPARMVRACQAIVHEGADVEQAISLLAGNHSQAKTDS
jgi:fructose-bisphosphate aldolase, class I